MENVSLFPRPPPPSLPPSFPPVVLASPLSIPLLPPRPCCFCCGRYWRFCCCRRLCCCCRGRCCCGGRCCWSFAFFRWSLIRSVMVVMCVNVVVGRVCCFLCLFSFRSHFRFRHGRYWPYPCRGRCCTALCFGSVPFPFSSVCIVILSLLAGAGAATHLERNRQLCCFAQNCKRTNSVHTREPGNWQRWVLLHAELATLAFAAGDWLR